MHGKIFVAVVVDGQVSLAPVVTPTSRPTERELLIGLTTALGNALTATEANLSESLADAFAAQARRN